MRYLNLSIIFSLIWLFGGYGTGLLAKDSWYALLEPGLQAPRGRPQAPASASFTPPSVGKDSAVAPKQAHYLLLGAFDYAQLSLDYRNQPLGPRAEANTLPIDKDQVRLKLEVFYRGEAGHRFLKLAIGGGVDYQRGKCQQTDEAPLLIKGPDASSRLFCPLEKSGNPWDRWAIQGFGDFGLTLYERITGESALSLLSAESRSIQNEADWQHYQQRFSWLESYSLGLISYKTFF